MRGKTYRHDMTLMFAMHDAMRRELETIARFTERGSDDPAHILRTALGWQMFKEYLHVHHTAEDEALWPAVRVALAGRPDDLALIDAMEAEHAAVGPGIAFLDTVLADREAGPQKVPAIVERLIGGLGGHFTHEEDEALAIIDDVATPEILGAFGARHSQLAGAATPRFLPWMLDGADDGTVSTVLGLLPPPLLAAYRDEWAPAYADLDIWAPRAED